MKLTIVIPVYNVEKYLDNCVNSIVTQTLKELEIILVDDGSTDSSGILCDKWAENDPRITVYHKENGGLMSAWKYGAVRAKGKYVGFVDSDDWIDPDMYEKMLALAVDSGADLVCSAFVSEYPNEKKEPEAVKLDGGLYNRKKIEKEIFPYLLASSQYKSRILSPSRVTKLFEKGTLLSILEECNEGVSIGEDLVTTFAFLQKAKSVYITNRFHPYHYRINCESMIQRFSKSKYQKLLVLRDTLLRINGKYKSFSFEEQIHTDYVNLFFGTMENEIFCSRGKRLAKSIRNTFRQEETQYSVSKCNISMLNKKTRLYLILMQFNLEGIVILLRKTKKALDALK